MAFWSNIFLNLVVNTFDAVIFYILFCGFTNKRVRLTKDVKRYICSWGVVFGVLASVESIHDNTYNILGYLAIIIILNKLFNETLYRAFKIFVLMSITIIIVQTCVLIVYFQFIDDNNLLNLLIKATTCIIVLTVYFLTKLHYALIFIEEDFIVECFFYSACIVGIALLFAVEFDLSQIVVTLPLFVCIMAISVGGFYKAVSVNNSIKMKLERKVHDFNNVITNIDALLYRSDDLHIVQQDFSEYLQAKGYKIIPTKSIQDTKIEGFLSKKRKYAKTQQIEVLYKVQYCEENALVKNAELIEIIGILTDNAMEASEKVIVEVFVDKDNAVVKVENATRPLCEQQIHSFFKSGFTSKVDSSEHGKGLRIVNQIVKQYNGELRYFNVMKDENYLQMEVKFLNCRHQVMGIR